MQYLTYLNSPEGTISFKSSYFPVIKAQEQIDLPPSFLCAEFGRPLCKTEPLKAGSVDQAGQTPRTSLLALCFISGCCLWIERSETL